MEYFIFKENIYILEDIESEHIYFNKNIFINESNTKLLFQNANINAFALDFDIAIINQNSFENKKSS